MATRVALCLAVAFVSFAAAQEEPSLSVGLMQSTFKLEGRAPGNSVTIGTGFILMRPLAGTPAQNGGVITGEMVLVTAAHVFEGMIGDTATIHLRIHDSSQNRWVEVLGQFKIRDSTGAPLWKRNPEADIAVMYVRPPFQPMERVIPTTLLANDDLIQRYGMDPGVELNCLGYPLGDQGIAGFPILRTGVIASYPLVPTRTTKGFLFDFRVFEGNSGGPVYFEQQNLRGSMGTCCGARFLMGLVTDEHLYKTPPGGTEPYAGVKVQQLSIGVVVHASLIAETINLLPSPELPESKPMIIPIQVLRPPPFGAQ